METSNDRLRAARENAGFKSARAAALRFGWTPSTYASHENGQTPDVPMKAAREYAKAFRVSAAWIITGEPAINHPVGNGSAKVKPSQSRIGQLSNSELDNRQDVPEIDVRAGASYAGGFNQEENTIDESGNSISADVARAFWGIPTSFLRDELRARPGQVHILPIRGDSMNDALFDGDRAIINLDDTDVSQGGIFALLDDNASVIIKQVELVRAPGARRTRCTSRNPVYTAFELELTEPVKIIGRVASKITRL